MVDPQQHRRYLAYLKKYEYFGQGLRKLGLDEFVRLDAELASNEQSVADERRREALKLLLRD